MSKQNESKQETPKAEGLELLDDKTLAAIVRRDIELCGELRSPEACIAFKELARRSGYEVPD